MKKPQSLRRIFAVPLLLALLSIAGLVVAPAVAGVRGGMGDEGAPPLKRKGPRSHAPQPSKAPCGRGGQKRLVTVAMIWRPSAKKQPARPVQRPA